MYNNISDWDRMVAESFIIPQAEIFLSGTLSALHKMRTLQQNCIVENFKQTARA